MVRAAVAYAARGWPVFPLAPRNKVPLISKDEGGRGACDATTDEEQIRQWWRKRPDANIGLTLPDMLVVDVDPRNSGDETWGEIIAPHGWPLALEAQTGSGGVHLVFQRLAFQPRCKPWRGVDIVTGPHRYIVAAPSIHPCGGRYRWIERMAPPPVPQWLSDLLRRDESAIMRQSSNKQSRNKVPALNRASKYLARCPVAVTGQGGHQTTFTVALKLAWNFPELDQGELWVLLSKWNQHCCPPWSKRELMHKLIDAMRSAHERAA